MRIDPILLAALAASLPLTAAAQAAAPADTEKKAAAAKKDAAPKKDAPAKDAKAPPKAPPKMPPKKADPKKVDKGRTQQVNPNVTIYRDAKDAPVMRDKQGNVIPTDPNAYDVSSAVKK